MNEIITPAPLPDARHGVVTAILGAVTDPEFADRRRCFVDIGWGDAAKHRQLARSEDGRELRIMLPRGSFLGDGAVLADDGTEVLVVRRPPEDAISVPFGPCGDADGARRMLLLGYLLGNQHAPLDVGGAGVAVPLFTSAQAARAVLAELGVRGEVAAVPLAAHGWTNTSSDHRHSHAHD
ncbi:urease accessory protein UreE [Nocardia sp. NPDC052254]|uniref:urease accessory protein UreE n=1 Tax=Nocardia sp. NPDC052254 TaxID=3155681 RepID=UPI003425CFA6